MASAAQQIKIRVISTPLRESVTPSTDMTVLTNFFVTLRMSYVFDLKLQIPTAIRQCHRQEIRNKRSNPL